MVDFTTNNRYIRYGVRTIAVVLLYFCYVLSVCLEASHGQPSQYPSASCSSLSGHREHEQSWSTIGEGRRRRSRSRSLAIPTQESVVNRYPEGTPRYAVFAAYQVFKTTRSIDHIVEGHYDPYGKKCTQTIIEDCRTLLNRPYQGYVNGKYTTFFPQKSTEDMIRNQIEGVLANPYRITLSRYNSSRSYVAKGKFVNGVTTAVVIVQQSGKWNVKTAYPKFSKT